MTDPASPVSIVRQSELLSVCRATLYYKPKPVDAGEARLRRLSGTTEIAKNWDSELSLNTVKAALEPLSVGFETDS